MTTFVRRIPARFQDLYTAFDEYSPAPFMQRTGYMEPELAGVPADEHSRHEKPESFVDVSGSAPDQRKDMPFCFAPYDGLRGLGMRDVVEFDALGADASATVSPAVVLPAVEQRTILPAPRPAPIPAPPVLRSGDRVPVSGSGSDGDSDKGIPLPALALVAVGALLLIRRLR